jgi:hypothetical protein
MKLQVPGSVPMPGARRWFGIQCLYLIPGTIGVNSRTYNNSCILLGCNGNHLYRIHHQSVHVCMVRVVSLKMSFVSEQQLVITFFVAFRFIISVTIVSNRSQRRSRSPARSRHENLRYRGLKSEHKQTIRSSFTRGSRTG